MKQQEVFKKIGVIIQEINEQYEYLQGTADNLNDLELELFVANTHFLKDHAEILRKLNAIKHQPVIKNSIKDEPKWFEPVVQPAKPAVAPFKPNIPAPVDNDSIKFEIVRPRENELQFEQPVANEEPAPSVDLSDDTPEDIFSFEREEPETIRHELILEEAGDFEDEEANLSQNEILLTPVADTEEKFEVESAKSDAESAKAQDEPFGTQDDVTPAIKPGTEITEALEPVSAITGPGPVVEEAPEVEPALFDQSNKKAKKALAESMEDIQVDNLQPKNVEKEAEPVLTLNQRLSAQRKETKPVATAAPAVVIEPLADIKTAITLNDKLLFVKDLFKGYNLAYTEAIEIVNRFSSFEEADRFLKNNYVTKNNWDGKKETSDKFYSLLKRRYA